MLFANRTFVEGAAPAPHASRRHRGGKLFAIGLLVAAALTTGCKTTQPHIVTKIIIQHDNVAAEASAEWR